MKWTLILLFIGASGYSDPIVPSGIQTEFDGRDLCVAAKQYYESAAFKRKMLEGTGKSFINVDAQCHQKDYLPLPGKVQK